MSGSFFQELKRRNVFRVAAIYVVVSWLLMQIGDVMFPALRLPEWTITMLVAFLLLGFPFALIFAWAYEITADGVLRTEDVPADQSNRSVTAQKFNRLIIPVLALAVVVLLVKDYLTEKDTAPAPAPTEVENSIAVLPFKNQSASTENAEFFAAGVHDELLTLLSRIEGFKVISRTSVERLDKDLTIPEIGKLLGVATVLEGQVQRAGDRLRINVQLIRTTEEDHLWATTYDGELTATNIFDVQSDIARSIAGELHVQLSADDDTLLKAVPTDDIEALQLYMLARQLLDRGSYESLDQARVHLREVTERDPEYADAWSTLAHVYTKMYQTGQIDLQEYETGAAPAITQALQIDKRMAEAHAELAALQWQTGDIVAAESSFQMALQLGPSNLRSLYAYANYLRSIGRPREAIPLLKRALANDPLSVATIYSLGLTEMFAGRPEQFIAAGKRILALDPASISAYAAHVQAYFWMGRYDLMWPWYMKAMASDPADYELPAHLGLFLQYLGDTETADRYFERALQMGPEEPTVLRCYAGTLVDRGLLDQALEVAELALEKNLSDRWQSQETFLRIVRDDALRNANPEVSRSRYLALYPELFSDAPKISLSNVNIAADLAFLLQQTGETHLANAIIEAGLAWYRRTQPADTHGFLVDIVDVEFLALGGQKQTALDTLRQAVDSGWNANWRSIFRNGTLASLRDDPQFKEISAELGKEMQRQLSVIQAYPGSGESDLRNK